MNDIMGNKQIASLQDVISPLISKTIDSGARSIFRLIKPLVVPSITVRENDWQYYNDIHRTLYKLNPKEYNRHRIPTKNKNLYDLTIGTRYIHKIDDRNYLVIIEEMDVQTSPALKYLTINFYGLNRHKNRDTFLKKMRRFDKSTITLRYLGRDSLTCEVSPREFDSIILKKETKDNIIRSLISWKNSKDWYTDNHLVYKIGVLLYGDPGTGKSSVARAISSMFHNAPILIIDPTDMTMSIADVLDTRSKFDGTIVVLFEDIDMYCKKRCDANEYVTDNNDNNLIQNTLFQLIDGVFSTNDTIYIATTNHIDRLDPALIRHGRFDIREEMTKFSLEECYELIEQFGYRRDIASRMNLEGDGPFMPAYIQSEVMRIRSMEHTKIEKEID